MANSRRIRTNLDVSGTATVTGATTLSGTLSVPGISTLGTIAGNTVFSGATVTFQNDVQINDDLVVTGDLTVNGAFSFAGGSVFADNTFRVQDNVDATKEFGLILQNQATGTLVAIDTTGITASRTYQLPDVNATLVGIAATQVLTNKTIDADLNTLTNIEDADIKSGAAIARSKIAAGSNDHVVINSGAGALNSEAQLAPVRGGTGQDFSAATGIVKVTAGSMSAATILNTDVDAAAAIGRTKIASGTANHVLINDGTGAMSSEASLAETRGGTSQATYTTGDILYASAANTLSKLPVGASGQRQVVSAAGLPSWEFPQATREIHLSDDFMSNATTVGDSLNWQSWSGGAGAGAANASSAISADHPGVLRFTTGTTATGRGGYGLAPSATAVAQGVIPSADTTYLEYAVNLAQLSTGAEEFVATFGLMAHSTSDTQVNGVLFKYDRALYGVNWQCETVNVSTTTRTDSGVAVATGWVRLRIEANTTDCRFYINETLVATNSTNIPTVVSAPGFKIQKTVGITGVTMDLDYFSLYRRFSSAR